MDLNVFLLLPQDNDIILEIIQDENSFKNFIKEVSELLSNVRKDSATKLFYDAKNIQNFLAVCQHFDNEVYLNKAKSQVEKFISTKSTDIATKPLKDTACIYLLWNYDKLTTVEYNPYETLSEIAEKYFANPNEKYLLLNLSEHIKACRNVILVCKDAKHIPDLPKFARIPFITDKGELELWLKTNHVTKFSLFDKNKFSKIGRVQQGKPVFQENETGYYWYLDNLHKDEYEVFNATKEHIGTANLDGELDTTQKVNGRKIDL
jgi:hypothetical protein